MPPLFFARRGITSAHIDHEERVMTKTKTSGTKKPEDLRRFTVKRVRGGMAVRTDIKAGKWFVPDMDT